MLPSSQLRDVTLKDYLIILKRRIWVILACFITISSWFTIKSFQKVSIYSSFAKVQIQSTNAQLTPEIRQVSPLPMYIDKEFMQTQLGILNSRTMAKKAVELLIASGDTSFVGMSEPDKVFSSGVNVSVQIGTQIINIGYTSTDPIKSAKFANALANTYLQEDVQRKVVATKSATGWLEVELEGLKKNLDKSEVALNSYIKENEIVENLSTDTSRSEPIIDQLKKERVRIENEISEVSKRYKEKHPRMIALRTRLRSIEDNAKNEADKLFDISDKRVEYNTLKREVESNKYLYETVLRRIKETEVSKDLQTSNIRIIDYADVPRSPSGPNRRRDVSTGIMMGMMVGLGLAFLLEYLDSTIKNAEDVEAYVKLPFLGYIPSAKQDLKNDKDIDLACNKLPQSRVAEAFRSVRTSLLFSTPEDKPLKTILITSTSPQEGKTTVSINLSIVFAYAKEKTLLIEADMRKPRISHSLNTENNAGLSSYLAGTTSFEESIKQSFIPNLFVMPSGPKPPNPAELLTSTKSRSLLEEAKTKFDRVIIDTSPVLTVADASIIANMVDGVVQVIRASFQNVDLILRSRQRLVEVKARIIGVILNNVDVKKEDSYYYYHYYYASKDDK